MAHDRDEVERAFLAQQARSDAYDWGGFADNFTADATYVEHQFGTFVGAAAIREWLVPLMAPLDGSGWTYPLEWYLIDGDRVVYKWLNRMPNPDPDGAEDAFQFSGVTVLEYGGDGKWARQEDFYNFVECEKVLADWSAAGGSI